MKVSLYGASGMVGSRILDELVSRGHQVTAVVRNRAKITRKDVVVAAGDVLDAGSVAATAKGADAAISSFAPPQDHPNHAVEAVRTLSSGLKDAGVRRLLMVGGAGSLEVKPGLQLVDTPEFPAAWKPIALAHRDALAALRETDLDWSYLSPAAFIQPGERTGKFRLGSNSLLTDANGQSRISAEDYAIAVVDEIENPKHIRQRFTVAY